jgi:hypothetical protein
MPNLSIRFNNQEVEDLDRLVVAVRSFYEREATGFAPAAKLATETTRSSALRDLLLAWRRGDDIPAMFSRELTEPAKNGA